MKRYGIRFALMILTLILLCTSATAEEKGLTPFDEPVTLSMMYETSVSTRFIGDNTAEDNVLTRFYKEKLNLDFDMSWQVDSGAYAQQLDLAIASSATTKLPDVFMANKSQIYTLSKAGLIADMTDIYAEYATDNLKQVLSFADYQGIESCSIDGRMYGLPLTNDVGDGASLIFIRKDWLDKLNLDVPSTLKELVTCAEAFVQNNVSGKKSTMGISMAFDLGFTWDVIANAFGAYPDLWLDDGTGALSYGSVQDGIRDALAYTHDLYDRGLIHKEFAAQDISKLGQYVAQGRLGILIGPFWYLHLYVSNNLRVDENAEWVVVNNLPLTEGGAVKPRAWDPTYRWLCVSSECENPEAAVKALNLWYEMWQGKYAEWYWGIAKSDEYGDVDLKKYSPVFFDPPLKNCTVGQHVRQAVEKGDPSGLNPEELGAYKKLTTDIGSVTYRSNVINWYGSFKRLLDTYDTFVYTRFHGPEDSMFNAMMSILDEMEISTFVDIIIEGNLDRFDEFVLDWQDQGGDMVTMLVNDWYTKNNK